MSKFGRYQVAEPPHNLSCMHVHDPETIELKTVDWEPKVAVLDQEDLIEQGIDTATLIAGAQEVDALGSCTAQTAIEALSNALTEDAFNHIPDVLGLLNSGGAFGPSLYSDTKHAEECAIVFYHECTDQTGDPSQEWPPTDCGSSGPFIVQLLEHLGVIKGQKIAHGADNVVSLMQSGGLMMGTPWAQAWMTPEGSSAIIDGNGSLPTVQAQLQQIAGGHEIYLSAIEELVLFPHGDVNPWKTIVRFRNHWTPQWGDKGNFRAHLSTFTHILASYVDFRQVIA